MPRQRKVKALDFLKALQKAGKRWWSFDRIDDANVEVARIIASPHDIENAAVAKAVYPASNAIQRDAIAEILDTFSHLLSGTPADETRFDREELETLFLFMEGCIGDDGMAELLTLTIAHLENPRAPRPNRLSCWPV